MIPDVFKLPPDGPRVDAAMERRRLLLRPCDNCGRYDRHTCHLDGEEYGPYWELTGDA